MAEVDPLFKLANWVEGIVWIAMACTVLAKGRTTVPAGALLPLIVIALVAFGVSDFVETTTGAWWRPWWLLVWKALCVLTLLACILQVWRVRRRKQSSLVRAVADEGVG